MTRIRDLIRAAFEDLQTDDVELVANQAHRKADKNDFFPYVIQEALNVRRARTRSIEDEMFRAPSFVPVDVEEGFEDRITRRHRLAKEMIRFNGRDYRWSDFTVEQHLERATALRAQAASLGVTADRHEKTASFLKEKGVVCLADLPEEDWDGWEQ